MTTGSNIDKNLGGRPRSAPERGRALNRSFAVYQDQIVSVAQVAVADDLPSSSAALRLIIDEGLRAREARLARNSRRRARGQAR